ncbi:EAL domain-containing protein [Nakamurella sp. A5-74]|uniref:EAL domain-containing protein n=1 Tax=Nakamurella sp. A5-74 TaxID=3158264 RepID=A0AAU8DW16_9ACTN
MVPPIIDLDTGRTVGLEALARWQHPNGEITYPGGFVPLAEDSDLIIDLDKSVMRRAFMDLRRWQRKQPDLRMSVNLSGRHFDQKDYSSSIVESLVAADVSAESIDLELTESSRLNPQSSGLQISLLRDVGFRIWLDDVGTGWSALDYLLRLPVNGIKIDRAVSVALGTHVGNAMTRAVTGLAVELDLSTIIEGIETVAQAELARTLGCTLAQGHLWSAAIPASVLDEAMDSLPDHQGMPSWPLSCALSRPHS